MKGSESICVIIAAYNASGTIERAIRSAILEPEVSEIIVVDDGSIDDTADIARSLDDGNRRLKVLVQPYNMGVSAARNRAMRESTSPWLCVLDSDDFFVPGRFKALIPYMPQAEMIADDMWQVAEGDINGRMRSLLDGAFNMPRNVDFTEFVLSNITKRSRQRRELGFIKPLMRREFLNEHKICYQEHMHLGEDFEIYARMLAFGARLLVVPHAGYVSVMRPNSLSNRHSENDLLQLRNCGDAIKNSAVLTKANKTALYKHYKNIDCRLQWRLLINAVKEKNIKAALDTFLHSYQVSFYLLSQLIKQIYIRSIKHIP